MIPFHLWHLGQVMMTDLGTGIHILHFVLSPSLENAVTGTGNTQLDLAFFAPLETNTI